MALIRNFPVGWVMKFCVHSKPNISCQYSTGILSGYYKPLKRREEK